MEFEAFVSEVGGRFTLTVSGELDLETAPALRAVAASLPPAADTLVDLTGLRFLDGAGMAALAQVASALGEAGGEFRLRGVQGQPRRALTLHPPGLLGAGAPDDPASGAADGLITPRLAPEGSSTDRRSVQ